jgi:hypothetical protein
MKNRILSYLGNFYIATGLFMLGWMTLVDANDLITQFDNWIKLRELEKEAAIYQQQIKEVQVERKEVLGTDRLREKLAREKYLMKKPTEDIFVIVDESNEPLEK